MAGRSLERVKPWRRVVSLIIGVGLALGLAASTSAAQAAAGRPVGQSVAKEGAASTPAAAPQAATPAGSAFLPEWTSVTHHTIQLGGQTLAYTATAGAIHLRDGAGKALGSFFYVSYTKDSVTDRAKRPLFISFNGGPGAASVWMHMGFTGPKRVLYDDEGFMLQPPFRAVDNEHTILDIADIVYIDPMATGYSRMLPGEDLHKYHGTREDLDSVAEFIRLYVTRAKRWDSPKFLIGESYGTTRAAGLASVLQTRHKMYLNGIVLVSCMSLGVQTGGDLGVMTTVPHLTATAWYHKRLPADLQAKPIRAVLDEAERFATTEFIAALVRGNTLTAAEKGEVAKKLSRYTGLSPEYLLRANLRVDRGRFRKELLRSEGLTVGRLDTRYKGVDRDRNGLTNEYDPAMEAWNGPFTAVVNKYLREELGVETDLSYAIAGEVSPWKSDATVNVGQMLQEATSQNPFLRVLVLEGYYDGATDAFGAQYAFSHIDANGDWKDRLTFAFYECGHMMYIRKADLAKAKKDIADFVRSALPK